MKPYSVLVADANIHADGLDLLRPVADLTVLPPYSPTADLIAAAAPADAILARTARISADVIEAAPRLKVVSRHGVGFDSVDVAACTAAGIAVAVSGDAGAVAVSEYAMAMLFALARRVAHADADVKAGNWRKDLWVGAELFGKTLGIVGLGRIGSRTARHATGFDMQVVAYDPYLPREAAREMGVELVDLPELLQRADFVILHMPLNAETRHMIGAAELALMKPTAFLVNVARGGLVDEEALYQALVAGEIAGAGLDVFAQEPLAAGHVLAQLENVLCSPHVAGQSHEALVRVAVRAAQNILRVFDGRPPVDIVNPEVLADRSRVEWVGETNGEL